MLSINYIEMSTNWLNKVAKHHKYFVNVVEGFGERFYAEDIVQEMYLRLHKYTTWDKIVKDGEVNKGFVWFVLRNIYVDFCKQKSKIDKCDLKEAVYVYDDKEEKHETVAKNSIDKKVQKEIDSWHWYDKMLFELYRDSGMSMREMELATKISLTSIFNTIKNCKQRLRYAVGEDYEDYKNGDFELLQYE
jgi:DNA-directed RNA polymerase specialized sigma24 family protein